MNFSLPVARLVVQGWKFQPALFSRAGNPLHALHYAPYGEPFDATGTAQLSHGFTGEPTDGNGLVYLRARYYVPSLGVFPSLDPVEDGNRYAFVAGNVVNRVDPSGMFDWGTFVTQSGDTIKCIAEEGLATTEEQIEGFARAVYRLNPGLVVLAPFVTTPLRSGEKLNIPDEIEIMGTSYKTIGIHHSGKKREGSHCPPRSRAIYPNLNGARFAGYIEGFSSSGSVGGTTPTVGRREVVYNFATFQRLGFNYGAIGGTNSIGAVGLVWYVGYVYGFTATPVGGNPYGLDQFISQYNGPFIYESGGASFGAVILPTPYLSLGVMNFHSGDWSIRGDVIYGGIGVSAGKVGVDIGGGVSNYQYDLSSSYTYIRNCQVDRDQLTRDILEGAGSPQRVSGKNGYNKVVIERVRQENRNGPPCVPERSE